MQFRTPEFNILAEEAAWPSPDSPVITDGQNGILAEEAAWPSPDSCTLRIVAASILAEEAAWPSPDTDRPQILRILNPSRRSGVAKPGLTSQTGRLRELTGS